MSSNNVSVPAVDRDAIEKALNSAKTYIDRTYLHDLSAYARPQPPEGISDMTAIRIIRIQCVVYNHTSVHSRLLSLFNTLGSMCSTCFLIIRGLGSTAELYLGIRSKHKTMAESAMKASMRGNLPGTEFSELGSEECQSVLSTIKENSAALVSVSQVPSVRDRADGQAQGIEHFIDAMTGKTYTAVIMAQPLDYDAVDTRRNILENLHTMLSPLRKNNIQFSEQNSQSDSWSVTSSITQGITDSLSIGYSYGKSQNSGVSRGHAPSIHTQFNALGLGFGTQTSSFVGTSTQQGVTSQNGKAVQVGKQQGESSQSGTTHGESVSTTIEQVNKSVEELLVRIDEQLSRIKDCEAYGLWECCAFFCAPTIATAQVAAGIYKALTCGTESSGERSHVNSWDNTDGRQVDAILESLSNGRMPVFKLSNEGLCNAGTLVSGSELPLLMQLPLQSVSGVAVVEMASFGRSAISTSLEKIQHRSIKVGQIYHMGCEEQTPVVLDIDKLSSHFLITGSTGVGKSTFIAMLIAALCDSGVRFMVVEPVKGEYRHFLRRAPGLQIFTVDPLKERMLRINPFEFSNGIHVLSHIDRLIEVFSVCWPLYAAQPALLRECIEEAYVLAGWDLSNSVYTRDGVVEYPDFSLLLSIVPKVIERSHFVGESKGTYEGALLTRVAMLTHGVFGQVFNSTAPLKDRELFDSNVIIDLSDVGSQETISLLMGVLVIRLREYRAACGRPDNGPLRHLMVLEEAHNILQRDSRRNDEGGESVAGQSVRMLSQCIAEMRGYGQGIIVADQAPGQIDLAGIRNTGTKFFMRQPEISDQDVAAGSLSLTEEQRKEIAKLPDRVALVYQTGWVEPVLVKVNKNRGRYDSVANDDVATYDDVKLVRGYIVKGMLQMKRDGLFAQKDLCASVLGIKGFPSAKLKDFVALLHAYGERFEFIPVDGSGRIERDRLYSRLVVELLACEDFLKLCPVPRPTEKMTHPYSSDTSFIQQCNDWEKAALKTLQCYVCGVEQWEMRELLEMLLLCDGSNCWSLTVHNALFGKIRVNTGERNESEVEIHE